MSLTINNYRFDGPYENINNIKPQSGVYVISTEAKPGLHNVHDIGESEDMNERLSTHDRADCWNRKADGLAIHFSAFYCDEDNRMKIEQELRSSFNDLCGEV